MKYVIKELDGVRALLRESAPDMRLSGRLSDAVRFVERNQICEVELWKKFVQLYRTQEDGDRLRWRTWRGEFWGKMMRGSCMIVAYTKNDGMYRILEASVRDMLSTQAEDGRISAYSRETEFTSWDLWERKYVMLGMMYFLEICRDAELERQILRSLCAQADYIMRFVGEGKKDIRSCSDYWGGMNSCSLLEPTVRLYRLTGKGEYLAFAEYIISTGFTDKGDLIELAYEDRLAPHEYPIVKAYEMMSCFEGLLQYYCITGIEKYRDAVVRFGRRVRDGEVSIIGCCGAHGELFSNTRVKQTRTDFKGIFQETCVTVTWMKLAEALLSLTGDASFADCIEQSFYNAYMGAMNTQRVPYSDYPGEPDVPQVLPFDSYSPLVPDRRGRKVGGYGIFDDGSFYGCCACIGGAGAGVIPQMAVMRSRKGVTLNFYENGAVNISAPSGAALCIQMDTAYPYDGRVVLTLGMQTEETFELALRIPAWCKGATVQCGGDVRSAEAGYLALTRTWKNGDTVVLDMPMPVVKVVPPVGADNEADFNAYTRGPIVLAADRRVCDPDGAYAVTSAADGSVAYDRVACPEVSECRLCVTVALDNKTQIRLIDYASAGKTWTDESRCAAWIRSR